MSGPSGVREFCKPSAGRERPPSFLLICDEWSPTRGGISRFNRSLAAALAAAGHRTLCLVESATVQDFQDAAARGVTLCTAESTPDGPNLYVPSAAVLAAQPDVVIGHDIVSGSVAQTYARRYLQAALVYIIHTPPQIEVYKRDEATQRTEQRELRTRKISEDADVVAAVGPLLTRGAESFVSNGYDSDCVLQLDPGMDVPTNLPQRRRRIPAAPTVLVLGRGTHVQAKGLDIAARAVAGVTTQHGRPSPGLLVQGGPVDGCDALRRTLVAESGLARDQVDVRAFTGDLDQVAHSLRRAALCLMPSRVEGFGLASLEAIGHGTPVLVTAKSGLAETLRSHLGTLAEPMIVDVTDNLAEDVPRWRDAIQRLLDDLPSAFDYTHDVRERLRKVLCWDATVSRLVTRLDLSVSHRELVNQS
ncbi:MAG: glycosyltransferase family 4 protein [Kibdelosporangium sp.]